MTDEWMKLCCMCICRETHMGFPGGSDSKESACSAETQVQSLGWEDVPEKRMATHSSILVWRIPWTEEPGELHTVHGVTKSRTQLNTQAYTHTYIHNETLLGHKKRMKLCHFSNMDGPRDYHIK